MSILQMMMAGLSLEYEGVITSGDLHIATKDGEAMFFHDSIDFSAYAGTDGGSTPFRFVFFDSAGKTAIAYGGAAGGGEALGAELITSVSSSISAQFETFTINANGKDIDQAVNTAGLGYANTNNMAQLGRLVQINTNFSLTSGDVPFFATSRMLSSYGQPLPPFVAGAQQCHWTFSARPSDGQEDTGLWVGAVNTTTDFSLTWSCKAYTDVPATGLHLMSTKNGTTRNMASVETGFNPNKIVGVKIYG